MTHSHFERKDSESKSSPGLALELKTPTGNESLDDFVTAGFNLINTLPRIWRNAIISRIKNKEDNDELAADLKQSSLKTTFIRQNIAFYLTTVKEIENETWWKKAETLIHEQLLRFCYDVPIITLWKEKNPVVVHVSAQYKKYLLQQQPNEYEKRIKTLDTLIESAGVNDQSAISPRELQKTFAEFDEKEKLFIKLEKQCSTLLKTTQTEWAPYTSYPLFRPSLLLLIANMLVYMSEHVTRYKPKLRFFNNKLFRGLQTFDDMLQIKMKHIATVLLWQEKSYQETGSADLLGKLSKDLNAILSPYLNAKQFNCQKYVFNINEWDHIDLDLIKLFSKIQKTESGVDVFYQFSPKEQSIQSQSHARQEFIKRYGSSSEKKEVQLFSDFYFISTKLLSLQNPEFKQKNTIRDKINAYVKSTRLRIGVMPRLHMFASATPFTEEKMLEELKKYGKSSEGIATAKKLCLLQRIYINVNDKEAWEGIIKCCLINKEKKLTLMLISLFQEFCNSAKIEMAVSDKDTSALKNNVQIIERFIENLQNSPLSLDSTHNLETSTSRHSAADSKRY